MQKNSQSFSETYIIGDSMIHGLEVDNAVLLSIPGVGSNFVMTAATTIFSPGSRFLFLVCETNDLVDREKISIVRQIL